MKITECYGIKEAVPFLDVHVDRDNKLFVDPFGVRHAAEPAAFVAAAKNCMDSFFAEVVRCSLSQVASERRRGEDLLSNFKEPRETRLGLALHGFDGHGAAADLGGRIWHALTTSLAALVNVGLLRRVEQLPLFVEGVGADVTSDLTTRLILKPLLDYTIDMMSEFPSLAQGEVLRTEVIVWDSSRREWGVCEAHLPAPHGKPLVLVPADWAAAGLQINGTRFYEKTILDFAQSENLSRNSKGKVVKVTKPTMKLDPRYSRATQNQIAIVVRALEQDVDLLARFDAWVTSKYDGPDQERNARRIA